MVIGIMKIRFSLWGCSSLKEKRKILKSLLRRLRNEFNLSAAETAFNDILQTAEIGISMTGNETKSLQSKIDKLINFIDSLMLAEISAIDKEIIHF